MPKVFISNNLGSIVSAQKQNKFRFIQLAYLLSSKKVIQREFGNLQKINNNYPKYVISMDEIAFDSYSGIEHLRLHDFLLKTDF